MKLFHLFTPNNYVSLLETAINRHFGILLGMKTDKIITELRKEKNWSQTDLADRSDVSRVMIGKYERGEAVPSIEAAKKIADAFGVSLDYLVGEGQNVHFDKKILKRISDIQGMSDEKKTTLFDLIDTYVRDDKAKQAYA